MIVRQRGRVRESMSMCASVWLVARSCDMRTWHEEHEHPSAAQCRVLSWRRRCSLEGSALTSVRVRADGGRGAAAGA